VVARRNEKEEERKGGWRIGWSWASRPKLKKGREMGKEFLLFFQIHFQMVFESF
jgi:hypothetical protein